MYFYLLLFVYCLYAFVLKNFFAFYFIDVFLQTSIMYVCYYFCKNSLLQIFFLSCALDMSNLNVMGSSFAYFLLLIIMMEKIHLRFSNRHELWRFCFFNLLGYFVVYLINMIL